MKSLIAQRETDIVAVEPIDAGGRLYEAFLAGRSAQARRAYARDLIGFAVFPGEPKPTGGFPSSWVVAGRSQRRVTRLSCGNGRASLTPATINHGLITDEE